jgi:hypothetical protein
MPPLRDPTPRGIEQVGGRHWTEGLQAEAAPPTSIPPAEAPPVPASEPGPPPPPPLEPHENG